MKTSVQAHGLPSFASTVDGEPSEFYEQVRRIAPVVWDEVLNAWLVTSMGAAKEVLRRDQVDWTVPEKQQDTQMPGIDSTQWRDFMAYRSDKTLLLADFPEHNRMHRWWMRKFSGRGLRVLGDSLVRPLAHSQIARFSSNGRAELYEEFAHPLASRVIAATLGLPWEDDQWLQHVHDLHAQRMALMGHKIVLQHSGSEPDHQLVRAGYAAVEELSELIRPYVHERRSGDGDDFISLIWREAEELFGGSFDEQDIIATANIAFSAGSTTTSAATSAGLYLMMTGRELQDRLTDGGDDAISHFVEETLRLYPSIVSNMRLALRDVDLAGVTVRAGEMVILLSGAVNRDPEHYGACAHGLDLQRHAPRDHLAFLRGAQTCPGQGLARTQLSTIFSVTLERLKNLRLDSRMPPPQYAELFLRVWRPLHATFTAQPEHSNRGPKHVPA